MHAANEIDRGEEQPEMHAGVIVFDLVQALLHRIEHGDLARGLGALDAEGNDRFAIIA